MIVQFLADEFLTHYIWEGAKSPSLTIPECWNGTIRWLFQTNALLLNASSVMYLPPYRFSSIDHFTRPRRKQ